MNNSEQKKDNSGWWGLLAILFIVGIAILSPQKPSSQTSTTPSSSVSCSISIHCGGGTKLMTREQCTNSICCQVGNQWLLKDSSLECKSAQNTYNNLYLQKLLDNTPTYNYGTGNGTQNKGGCCKYCTTGKPCGDSCINKNYTCHVGPGCAC